MVKVFSPGQSHGRWAACLPVCLALVLTFALLAPGRVLAQPPSSTKPAPPAAAKQDTGSGGQATAKARGEADAAKDEGGADEPQTKDEKKADDQPPAEPPPDPSQTQKVSPVEVFKDPNAEDLLDVKKFNPIRNRAHDARRCRSGQDYGRQPERRRGHDGDSTDGRRHGRPVDRYQEHPGPDRSSSQICPRARR